MRWITLAALVLFLAADPDAIERAIRELGADDYATREKASAFLWRTGPPAEPFLRKALESGDAEVVARARDLLDKIPFGITPDSPKRLAALASRARAASASAWPGIVAELLEEGPDGLELARLITERQPDPARRAAFRRGIDKEGWQLARRLFADGEPDRAMDYLRRSAAWAAAAAEKDYMVVRNFAAAARLRGTLDAELARWQPWAGGRTGVDGFLNDGNPDAVAARVVVFFLAKAKGDRALQRQMADAAGVPELIEAARFDAGTWAELANAPPADRPFSVLQPPGLRMMYQHLAGTPEPTRGEFLKLADQHRANDALALTAFRILMYDRRPDDALTWIDGLTSPLPSIARAELLAQRGRLTEAVAQLAKLTPPPVHRVPVANALARALHSGGDAGRLQQHVAGLARTRYEPHETLVASDFVELLAGWGMADAAADHAAAIFATRLPASLPDIFSKLHKSAPLAAEAWLTYFRAEAPNDSWADLLKRLPPLVDRRLAEPTRRAQLDSARMWARSRPPVEREKTLRGLAEACALAGLTDLALEMLTEAVEFNAATAHLQRGDTLAEVGRWPDAAAAYDQAWQAGKQSLALWLCGFAKAKAGDPVGKDLQLRAHLIVPHDGVPRSAGAARDEQARSTFADELAKRAYLGNEIRAAVRIQRQLLVDLSVPSSALGRNALSKQLTDQAYADPGTAAAAGQRMLLRMARTGSSFLRNEGYLTVLYRLHAARALAALARDDVATASAAAAEARATLPLTPQLAADFVPELARRGQTKLADEFYASIAGALDKFIAEYPRAAQALADRAWLAARCGRESDAALGWALRAVESNPHALWPREVLVEVHLQRGERDRVQAVIQEAINRHPRDAQQTDMMRHWKTGA